jgi:methionine-rich copper-binding protein CopC
MKNLTVSSIIALVALAATFPTYAIELVKTEAINSQELVSEAKHTINMQFDNLVIEQSFETSDLQAKAIISIDLEKSDLNNQSSAVKVAE